MPLKDEASLDTTISFRLPQQLYARIFEYAEAAGVSKHAAAKLILIAALDGRDHSETMAALASISRKLDCTRGALGRGIGALLIRTAPSIPEDKVKRWIFEVMLKQTDESDGGTP
jgi:hypothetical protein